MSPSALPGGPAVGAAEIGYEQTAQEWEAAWWGDCANTFGEEAKQITYAQRMGLVNEPRDGKWPVYDLEGASVLDLGGGPTSLLLKCVNRGDCAVVDPCPYPPWVTTRYAFSNIWYVQEPAENFKTSKHFDEVWVYNVLQHVESTREVIETAKRNASLLRIFEWLETEPDVGHPHTLHADLLNDWIGSDGQVEFVDENGAYGLAYFGVMGLAA